MIFLIYVKLAENKEMIDKKSINLFNKIKEKFVKIREEKNENKI